MCACTWRRSSVIMRCADFERTCVSVKDVRPWIIVAPRTMSTIGVSRRVSCLPIKSSRKYFAEAGRTRPATRLTAIKPKPRISRPLRGFISAQTSGRFFHAFLRFFSLSLEARSLDAALALVSVVMIRGRHPSLLDARDAFATTSYQRTGDIDGGRGKAVARDEKPRKEENRRKPPHSTVSRRWRRGCRHGRERGDRGSARWK